jgi:hypothetical protein
MPPARHSHRVQQPESHMNFPTALSLVAATAVVASPLLARAEVIEID